MSKLRKDKEKNLKSIDCTEFLYTELKKEFIGPSDGLFNRQKYKKIKEKKGEDSSASSLELTQTPCLSVNYEDINLHRQEVLTNSPKYNYLAGILYPKETSFDDQIEHDYKTEESEDDTDNEDKNLESEKIESFEKNSENQNYDNIVADNDDPLDLTNEIKPSAMGLSVYMDIPELLLVKIKNIGQYYKIGKKETVPKETKIISFYISKYNDENKSSYKWFYEKYSLINSNQNTVENFVSDIFNIKKSTFKNNVDYFDKFFNQRRGWHQKVSSPAMDVIKNEFDNYSKEKLEEEIIKYIEFQKKDEPKSIINYEGFFRKNLNLSIEFKKQEILSNSVKKFIDKKGESIGLSIHTKVRKSNEKYKYVSFHLINENISDDKTLIKDCFFQCNFEITELNKKNIFKEYKEKNLKYMDQEEKSLHLLHRNLKSYAVGHGCAASWELNGDKCNKVFSEIFPTHEIKPIRPQIFEDIDLDMIKFSENINYSIKEIRKLVSKYKVWLQNECKVTSSLEEHFQKTSESNTNKAKEILLRVENGIKILEENKNAQEAFCFMNKAMSQQQFHYTLSTEKDFKFDGDLNKIDYAKEIINLKIGDKIIKKGKWYPFQIIFIILNLKSFIDPLSDDRKIMDLIWFPTGGGKTEAYLGLSAFVIFLRKIINPDSKGNAVIMRYTLRLLTTQQFLRASTLICACEKIRSENPEKLGKNEINIGLWIGGEATPNTETSANKILSSLENPYSTLENKFLIVNCPWCGYDMGPIAFSQKNKDGKNINGYKIERGKVIFSCENNNCNFSQKNNKKLPIIVIDERIYKNSPDLIIGTIDKFATLPWKEEAIECFAANKNKDTTDLIIQDELHLISGPLGSVAGMYEICLKALTEKNYNNKKISAKIVGSTATISRAESQISLLYGTKCAIFPPQTNQIEDSFFSYEKKDADGRKYVGIFCPSSSSPQITLSKVIASLLVNTKIFSQKCGKNHEIYDPYWTQLLYFNSIRELMTGASLIFDDVDEEKNALYIKKGIDFGLTGNNNFYRKIDPRQVAELTSRQDSSEIPRILNRLFVSKSEEKNYPYDICLATNMIQVGIDIPRLSLMIINGQPKTTSEYIQASSRVGRDQNSPGIVFNILSPFKPRDRSHYEHFKSYHQSLYNFVEPTSVTPHSNAVRKRCLHAVVITLCRLWDEKLRHKPNVPNKDLKDKVKKYIIEYVERSDPSHLEEAEKTNKDIDKIFKRWEEIRPLKYGSMSLDQSISSCLMHPSGSEKKIEGDQFETPTSMRNVDKECSAKIMSTLRGQHEQ